VGGTALPVWRAPPGRARSNPASGSGGRGDRVAQPPCVAVFVGCAPQMARLSTWLRSCWWMVAPLQLGAKGL